ncbi:glycosyltransferase [Leifsonia sp. H3M29-4]|uniref:glycosyltransferase n=1 Tax=Salinibacterium metalliresistens TaxID=3031321 RepID=UPI0023D9F36D|nr:glycosyltransferase [Salinibacterium metalliresistens]MDF1479155.1 glycosyltransferase [Salinibacterium metalliresistens]
MRVVIVSRIFAPEVSAAAGLLTTWARTFRDRGCEVSVVTTNPPRGMELRDPDGIRVRRAPVLRDRQQYVRGYLSYLSFDVPLFFRLLFARRADLYVVEPPPTTVAVVRVVAALRRTPYIVDAADLWSDAAAMATNSRLVLRLLRRVEVWGLKGAQHLLAAHEPLIARFRELGIHTPSTGIGFGADTDAFHYEAQVPPTPPVFVYAGTHSEWHGAGIFVEAFAKFLPHHPGATLRFIGNGQEREALRARAAELGIGGSVSFHAPIPPAELSPILAGATASLASLKPGQGYDYAFTTKAYSSLAAGCPVIFAGVGPTGPFLRNAENTDAGVAVDYEVMAVVAELERAATRPLAPAARARLSDWARSTYSLDAIAERVVTVSLSRVAG